MEEADGDEHVAQLSDQWEIWGPNGGYLAAIALRAAGTAAEIRQPASFYCHFLSSPAFDAVQLNVKVLKRGRRAESFTVEMSQQGKPILHALVKTAADAPGYSHQHPEAPQVPAPETLKSYEDLRPTQRPPRFSFWKNIERQAGGPGQDRSAGGQRRDRSSGGQRWDRQVRGAGAPRVGALPTAGVLRGPVP